MQVDVYPPLGPFLINMTRENLLDTKITNDKNKFPTLEFWEARNESARFEQIKNFVFD